MDTLLRILLVEDDSVDAAWIERGLQADGPVYSIKVARNGTEALELLQPQDGHVSFLPEIILLDLKMPQMDGLDCLRAIRRDTQLKHCIVFVLTNSGAEADMQAAYAYSVAGYIVKSDLDPGLTKLRALLGVYRTLVEFPPPRLRAGGDGTGSGDSLRVRSAVAGTE